MLWEHDAGHTVLLKVISCFKHRGQILHPISFALLSQAEGKGVPGYLTHCWWRCLSSCPSATPCPFI